jgi:tetratricopeptide (TPR) repeat protein
MQTASSPASQKLVQNVRGRIGLTRICHSAYWMFLGLAIVLLVGLLLSRLLGLFHFSPMAGAYSLGGLMVGSLLLGVFWHRRVSVEEAARRIDQALASRDLFLTTVSLGNAAGEYQSLVSEEADDRALGVAPHRIVPLNMGRPATHLVCIALGFLIAFWFLPQWDPWGVVATAQKRETSRQLMSEDRKATQLRMAAVKKESDAQTKSPAEKSVENLLSKLKTMKPNEQAKNLKELNERQRDATEKWRALAEKTLNKLLTQGELNQDFGGERERKLREWTRDLAQGNDAKLQTELKSLQDAIDELSQLASEGNPDPAARAELEQKVKERLKALEKLASDKVGSPELAAAVKRALRQMEAAQNGGDPQEAMEALRESMELAKMELKQIARSAQELKQLEKAMKVAQMAKQLNAEGKLNGQEPASDVQSVEDYEELYAQMMAGQSEAGEGTGGEGIGEGGVSEEDDAVATEFKDEETPVAVQAGKILMSLEGRGVSSSGETTAEYEELVSKVKQGVSEAIEREQVPPGYHEAIRKYFDGMGQEDSQPQDRPDP